MALSDFNPRTNYYWYKEANNQMSDFETYTSPYFGTGKTNTNKLIEKWNAKGYGLQTSSPFKDIWGEISNNVKKGWFVPSRAEWAAFNNELGVTIDNYTEFNLNGFYWSSSQYTISNIWGACLYHGSMHDRAVDKENYIRLAATF